MKKKAKLYFYLFLPIILGGLIGFIIKDNINYNSFIKPTLTPKEHLFPFIWSILYLLMGLSYLVFKEKNNNKKISIIYYSQLFTNLLWSFIFFLFKNYFLSILWIIILYILVLLLIINYYKNNYKLSSFLIIPYFLWIIFATYLTVGIYLLN